MLLILYKFELGAVSDLIWRKIPCSKVIGVNKLQPSVRTMMCRHPRAMTTLRGTNRYAIRRVCGQCGEVRWICRRFSEARPAGSCLRIGAGMDPGARHALLLFDGEFERFLRRFPYDEAVRLCEAIVPWRVVHEQPARRGL